MIVLVSFVQQMEPNVSTKEWQLMVCDLSVQTVTPFFNNVQVLVENNIGRGIEKHTLLIQQLLHKETFGFR